MKFQRSAPRVLIFSVVVVVIGMAVLSNRLFSGLTSAVEQDQFELIRALWSYNLTAAENRALERAEMIAALPAVREAFAARDREGLLAQCAEMFKRQKERYGVDRAQFHFPPAVSFLRLHAPEQHGDHQDQFRPMVVAVNRDLFSRKESAIAGTGPAIFGVTPMTDAAGQHIGSFELGMNFGPLLHALKAAYRLEMALFVEEQPLRQLMFAEGLDPDVLTEQNRRGKYIKFHSTNWALMKELVSEGDLSGPAEAQYVRSAQDVPYGVVLLTLYNNAGNPIGKVAMARDFSSSRAAAGRSLVWQGLLALSGIVALGGCHPDRGAGPAAAAFGNVEPDNLSSWQRAGATSRSQRPRPSATRCKRWHRLTSSSGPSRSSSPPTPTKRSLHESPPSLPVSCCPWPLQSLAGAELPEAAAAAPPDSLSSLPMGKGLPVVVLNRPALRGGGPRSTRRKPPTRQRWICVCAGRTLRLQYPPESAPQGFLEFRDEAAAAKMAEIWTPAVSLSESLRGALATNARPPDLSGWTGRDDGAHDGHVRDPLRGRAVSF